MAVVTISPGDNIATVHAGGVAGTTYRFQSGRHPYALHSYSGITVRQGDLFQGEAGAIISGGKILSAWTQTTILAVLGSGPETAIWYATVLDTEEIFHAGEEYGSWVPAINGVARAGWAEDIYVNGQFFYHVESLSQINAISHYFDTTTNREYVAVDPNGKVVERCTSPWFTEPSTVTGVTFENLIFERFANPAQSGIWRATEAPSWAVLNCEFRENHGNGVRPGPRHTIRDNYVHHNGNIGISGGADAVPLEDIIVERNNVCYNNTAGFLWGWQGGGSKFSHTIRLQCRHNHFHHNNGPGFWADIDNIDATVEYNICDFNAVGIYWEISRAAVIRNNVCRNNGRGTVWSFNEDTSVWEEQPEAEYIFGSGILISASPGVRVHGNYLRDNADGINALQQNRGSGAYGAHETEDLLVYDNTVIVSDFHHPLDTGNNPWHGFSDDVGDDSYFLVAGRGNVFSNNKFYAPSTAYGMFTWWRQGNRSLAAVQADSNQPTELGSTVSTAEPPAQALVTEPWNGTIYTPGTSTGEFPRIFQSRVFAN